MTRQQENQVARATGMYAAQGQIATLIIGVVIVAVVVFGGLMVVGMAQDIVRWFK